MVLISPRIHFFEINDQPWFHQFLRERVQSCLTLAWTFPVPFLQKEAPANVVARTLYRTLSDSVTDYTYVDFCAGAGGPTPFIEKDLNARLTSREPDSTKGANGEPLNRHDRDRPPPSPVKFVLTDLHPHIPDWVEASKKSQNLGFVPKPVDATNAPADLIPSDGKKVFRLFNLAFHHFDDQLATEILRNTLENSDGFGIFELQERTISSIIMMIGLGLLFLVLTPIYFWRSPGHLFFTYIIPIVPFVLSFDGIISSLRTRTPEEIQELMKKCGASSDEWTIKYGKEQHTWPIGYVTWVIGIRQRSA